MANKKNYANKIRYAELLMQHNRNNPNISEQQADFLQKLASYRHLLHASPQQYFFNTRKTTEIDQFFALAHSQDYFKRMDLPFPKDIFALMTTLQHNKDMQFTDFDKSIEQFAYNKEAINTLIEKYLSNIDAEKGSLYCPRGENRDSNVDPVKLTIAKLKESQERISPYQQKIYKELEKVDKIPEEKLLKRTGMDL